MPGWLLYDYASKFFGLTVDDYIDADSLALAAKATRNMTADKFVRWWKQETGRLAGQEPGNILFNKRNVVQHRGSPAFTIYHSFVEPVVLGTYTTMTSSGSFLTSVVSSPQASQTPTGTLQPWSAAQQQQTIGQTPAQPAPDISFSDHPGESITSLCSRFLTALEGYVRNAHTNFP